MDDLSSAISGFLAQPGAMEQLETVAKQLGLHPSKQPEREQEAAQPEQPEQTAAGGLEELGLSPELLPKLMHAMQTGSQPSREATLLEALRPLIQNNKQEKLDRALHAIRLMHTVRAVTKSIER